MAAPQMVNTSMSGTAALTSLPSAWQLPVETMGPTQPSLSERLQGHGGLEPGKAAPNHAPTS